MPPLAHDGAARDGSAAEAFLSRFAGRLTPAEKELRDSLRRSAALSKALLGTQATLQEWAERRIPHEVTLHTSSSGSIHLLPDEELVEEPADDGGATEDRGELVEEPAEDGAAADEQDVSVADSGAPAGVEEFLAGLPTDRFSVEEEELRDALTSLLARGPLGVWAVEMRLRAARAAVMPTHVSLHDWVERRIDSEVRLQELEGKQVFVLVGKPARKYQGQEEVPSGSPKVDSVSRRETSLDRQPKDANRNGRAKGTLADALGPVVVAPRVVAPRVVAPRVVAPPVGDFFAGLPRDDLERGEEELRQALLDWITESDRSGERPTLSGAIRDKDVQKRRAAFLPREVSFREWIETRIGGEIECRGDNDKIELVIRGFEKKTKPPPKSYPPATQRKAQADAASSQDFLASLPADELTDGEIELRQVVIDWAREAKAQRPEAPLLLLDALKDAAITKAKTGMLPPSLSLRVWIDSRVSADMQVVKDDRGRAVVQLGAVAADDEEMQDEQEEHCSEELKEAFFDSLPEDGFTPEEEDLRGAILVFLEAWDREDPITLAAVGRNPAIRAGLDAVLQGSPISLRDWIDQRIGHEIDMMMHPDTGKWLVGLTGTLDRFSTSRKRKFGTDYEAADFKNDGNGKGKSKGKRKNTDNSGDKGWASSVDISERIFVGGFPKECTQDSIAKYFSKFGDVSYVEIFRDSAGESRGAGFVTFDSVDASRAVLDNYRDNYLDGKWVDCKADASHSPPGKNKDKGGGKGKNKGKKGSVEISEQIFAGGWPSDVDKEAIERHFSEFGVVDNVEMKYFPNSDKFRGFAFVTFDTVEAAAAVLNNYEKNMFAGKWLDCKPAARGGK